MSAPPNSMVPASGLVKPASISKVVVLPAPFGPMRPSVSPAVTSKSMPCTAAMPPNDLRSPRTCSSVPDGDGCVPASVGSCGSSTRGDVLRGLTKAMLGGKRRVGVDTRTTSEATCEAIPDGHDE